MASRHVAQQWDLGSLGRRKGREWQGQGQTGRHFGLRSALLIAAPRRPEGVWMALYEASIFLQTGYQDVVPALYLTLLGIKDKSVILAKCPPDISEHEGPLQGASPGNVAPRPPTTLGPTDMLDSGAGADQPAPVCPLGPASCLLPRSYFPWDMWLDTFQVRVYISEFGVCAAFGALWVP